jgi:hypothetical protein
MVEVDWEYLYRTMCGVASEAQKLVQEKNILIERLQAEIESLQAEIDRKNIIW